VEVFPPNSKITADFDIGVFNVNGNTNISNNLSVGGESDLIGSLNVTGNTKISGDLQLNGILKDLEGNARIFSNWTIASNTTDLYRPTGNVGIGTASPGYKLEVTGSIFYSSGGLNGSDDRIKHNEEIISDALSTILKLKPKHYIKTGKKLYDKTHNFELDESNNPLDDSGNKLKYLEDYTIETGIIAQEIKEIPELSFVVLGEEDNENRPLAVDYNSIHCTHIVATQELNKKVVALESENIELKTKNNELETKVSILEQKLQLIEQRLANAGF